MSSRLRNWINLWLVGVLVLGALYAYVLFLARNPNVSDAYRAYYVDRTSDLPVWLAEDRPNLMPATVLDQRYPPQTAEVSPIGWSNPEPSQMWSLGQEAALYFVMPEGLDVDQTYEVVLEGTYLGGQQRVIAHMGDATQDQVYSEGDDIVIPFRPGGITRNIAVLRLQLPDARQPSAADRRVLGFGLRSFLIRRGGS